MDPLRPADLGTLTRTLARSSETWPTCNMACMAATFAATRIGIPLLSWLGEQIKNAALDVVSLFATAVGFLVMICLLCAVSLASTPASYTIDLVDTPVAWLSEGDSYHCQVSKPPKTQNTG